VSRSYDANGSERFRPQVPLVVGPLLFAGDGEWLAWGAGCKDINHSRIACGVPLIDECSDIAEDGGVVEDAVCDSLFDDSLTVCVDLDIAN